MDTTKILKLNFVKNVIVDVYSVANKLKIVWNVKLQREEIIPYLYVVVNNKVISQFLHKMT